MKAEPTAQYQQKHLKTAFSQLLLLLQVLVAGCSATQHLKEGQYLIKSAVEIVRVETEEKEDSTRKILDFWNPASLIETGTSTIDPYILSSAIKTKENKRMLLPKTYLHLHMLGISLQEPLTTLVPPSKTGRTLNNKLRNDLFLVGRSKNPTLAFLKYINQRYFPKRPLVDSLGSFLEHTAGEAPQLLDSAQISEDLQNLKRTYFANGYFYAQDTFEVKLVGTKKHPRKAKVKYLIREGKAAVIDHYLISETLIPNRVMFRLMELNRKESKIGPGKLYNNNDFNAERSRIVKLMRNFGYYTFSPQMITFEVDTLPDSTDIAGTQPQNRTIRNFSPVVVKVKIADACSRHPIRKITLAIEPAEFDILRDTVYHLLPPNGLTDSLRHLWGIADRIISDTNQIYFGGYERILKKLNFNFLESLIEQKRGQPYSLEAEQNTQRKLQGLGIFKYVLVKHHLVDDSLNVRIEGQLLQKFQAKIGVEGFSENDPLISQNLPGFGVELGFRDLMVFKGAERLDLSLAGNASFFRASSEADSISTFLEGSGAISFTVPRFLIPFIGRPKRQQWQQFNPATSFTLDFTREDSRLYTRNSSSLDWNYTWTHNLRRKNIQSSLSPYVITFVTSNLSEAFRQSIAGISDATLRNLFALDFAPRFSSWGRYQFSLSNYMSSQVKPTYYLQPVLEMGGNTPFLIDWLDHQGGRDSLTIFGFADNGFKDARLGYVNYGQYLKLSVESRGHFPLSNKSSVVIRGLIGVAQPWNYTTLVPLASRFFAGGVNGMRGWQSNTLGPGTYSASDEFTGDQFDNLLNLGGEFQVEANLELRAKAYKFIEIALFSDLGNVWFLPGSEIDLDNGEGAKLSASNLLQLGWDAGIGFRLDFDFFIFRLDLAQQLYAPDLQKFVVKSFPWDLGGSRFQYNFGIGYPF